MKKEPVIAAALIVAGMLFLLGAVGNAEYNETALGLSNYIQIGVGILSVLAGAAIAKVCEGANK